MGKAVGLARAGVRLARGGSEEQEMRVELGELEMQSKKRRI